MRASTSEDATTPDAGHHGPVTHAARSTAHPSHLRTVPARYLEGHAHALLVGLPLRAGRERWPVLRVGPDGIDDIGGCAARRSAASNCGA